MPAEWSPSQGRLNMCRGTKLRAQRERRDWEHTNSELDGLTMVEYSGFLIEPGTFVYRAPIRFSVLRPESNGAVLIHEGVVKARFKTEKGATDAAIAAGQARRHGAGRRR
jgi:hypothetical protein